MKKFILIPVLIITCSLQTKAQVKNSNITAAPLNAVLLSSPLNVLVVNMHTNDSTKKDYEYYMHKRRTQKTVGWSLLGGGFLLTGVGFLLANSNSNTTDYNHTSGKGAVVCLVVAAAAGLASIPFMIMATSNKNKAKLLLNTQKTGYGIPVKTGNITGLGLSIPIGK